MSPLDQEARASRYLDAMEGLEGLLARIHPGDTLAAEPLGQLLSILNDEARKVVPRHVPGERAPGLAAFNDED